MNNCNECGTPIVSGKICTACRLSGSQPAADITDLMKFVSECCIFECGAVMLKCQLYLMWQGWCNEHKIKFNISGQFGILFHAAYPDITSSQKSAGRVYHGVKATNEVNIKYLKGGVQ